MPSYEIENGYDSRTWLHQKFDSQTWMLSQYFEVGFDTISNDDVILTRDNLKTLRDALNEILEDN